jgi:acetylornithine deacetylase/succinyl-diaminopimelate desuccinylase-like protein
MALRADALGAAARFVVAVHEAAEALPDAVATVGALRVEPGATNVVPELVELFADLRAPDVVRLDALVAAACAAAAAPGPCLATVEQRWRLEPVAMSGPPAQALRAAIETAGLDVVELSSGAGHDAGVLAAAGVPAAMLFVRSNAGGLSHAPGEDTDGEAIATAVEVLGRALRELAA